MRSPPPSLLLCPRRGDTEWANLPTQAHTHEFRHILENMNLITFSTEKTTQLLFGYNQGSTQKKNGNL